MARQNNYPIFENNSTVITAEFLNGLVNNVKTLNQEDGVFDISIANAVSGVPTTYNSLELALSGTNIPVDIRKGGMGVKFINSTTNKYEQWNLKASSWSTDTSDWALDVDGSVTDGKFKLPFELKRPNAGTPVTNATEIDLNNKPLDQAVPEVLQNDKDLTIEDKNGKAIVAFEDGHIRTKNFDSSDMQPLQNDKDLTIEDKNGKAIVVFEDGHIRTKKFNSRDIGGESADKLATNGKTFAFYGDSITAQGNGDYGSPFNGSRSWLDMIASALRLGKYYGRGVGGQTYKWGNTAWYCKAGGTGNYVSRFKAVNGEIAQANGSIKMNYTAAEKAAIESVLGYSVDIHRGCLCSWDRIKAQFPSSIKDDIAVVLIMGGTNDWQGVEDVVSSGADGSTKPEWDISNTTDTEWVNDALYYNGGDFDVTNTFGAMASAIMKMQVWMPDAVIVILTPPTRKGVNHNQPVNGSGTTYKDLTDSILYVADFMNVDSIDVCSKCGITQFNVDDCLKADGVHPQSQGWVHMSNYIVKQIRNIQL